MDELFGFISDAIAKKLREAGATVAAAEQAQEILRNVSRPNEPMGRPTPAPRPVFAQPIAPLDDIFPTVLEPLRATVSKHAAGTLLAAFSGGPPLLAAFILSEALAPPIALRQRDR